MAEGRALATRAIGADVGEALEDFEPVPPAVSRPANEPSSRKFAAMGGLISAQISERDFVVPLLDRLVASPDQGGRPGGDVLSLAASLEAVRLAPLPGGTALDEEQRLATLPSICRRGCASQGGVLTPKAGGH